MTKQTSPKSHMTDVTTPAPVSSYAYLAHFDKHGPLWCLAAMAVHGVTPNLHHFPWKTLIVSGVLALFGHDPAARMLQDTDAVSRWVRSSLQSETTVDRLAQLSNCPAPSLTSDQRQ